MKLLLAHFKELYDLPEEWTWQRSDAMTFPGFWMLTGAVYAPCKSGKRKGQPNWRKPLSPKRTLLIAEDAHRAWTEEWSKRTGLCVRCTGDGATLKSWDHIKGATLRPCPKCDGTGKREGKL